ncbi:MAG: hypothetical protein JF591_19410 [Lysobacter sp.]|nr:hypothetical protein [Lysobacter sp.]
MTRAIARHCPPAPACVGSTAPARIRISAALCAPTGELAGKPDIQVRETLIEIGSGKVAHIWMQASSPDQLKEVIGQTEGLRFPTAQLSAK